MKFAVSLLANILHILTKNQLGGHFQSVVNDVRVTSCSSERLSNEKVSIRRAKRCIRYSDGDSGVAS